MSYVFINKFVNKMRAVDAARSREVILTISEAQGLHADITKLLVDVQSMVEQVSSDQKPTQQSVEISGGSF